MQRLLFALFALLIALPGPGARAQSAPVLDSGWHEAVLSVRDFAPWRTFFVDIVGWKEIARGTAASGVAESFGLPANTPIEEVVIANPNEPRGLVRLMKFGGAAAQTIIRGAAQPWDTGGIFSLMVRSQDAKALYERVAALGWTAYNEPVDFGFGPSQLRNVILRGPDGINIGVYERLAPRVTEWPQGQVLAAPFNAMQTVRDVAAAKKFYADVLGFTLLSGGDYFNDKDEPNNFGLPVNYATKVARAYGIFARADKQAGSVELMQFAGFVGRDLAPRAKAPNLGILSLRYAVADAAGYAKAIAGRGAALDGKVTEIALAPYGTVKRFATHTPDGVRLEFFQPPPARR
jgi:catechol 2,3-dioxygenase-like lactoylglutathione lyase family enzyme